MRLDRNINPDGKGKYALIKLRGPGHLTRHGREITVSASMVDFGGVPETDFFVIRLKDKYAAPADYINNHPGVLHLWKPTKDKLPTPPGWMVGFKELNPA